MNINTATAESKLIRQRLDSVLQQLKDHNKALKGQWEAETANVQDVGEVIAQSILSQRDLESAIMRQGMALKNIGATPNPYPESYNPESKVIAPTADGLKM